MCIFFSSEHYCSPLSRAAPKKDWNSILLCEKHYWDTFASTLFHRKQECRYLIQLLEYIFAYLNFLYYIEFFIWQKSLAMIWHVQSHPNPCIWMFLNYILQTWLLFFFSFNAVIFQFLHSLIQCPDLWQ